MEVKEWQQIKSASSRGDMSLETIERMLGNFGEVVSIAGTSMTHDLIPYGQVSVPFWLSLFALVALGGAGPTPRGPPRGESLDRGG